MPNSPAVSVIIPMYNAEKYIAECLESLLAQTLQDFEVIAVDDCSTDSSPAIVESYRERFGGRLKLVKTETNSGTCAVPRNRGLPFSRGEYVFFMDADDLFTLTALEELYTLAKKFDAEVVCCEQNYEASADLSNIYIRERRFASYVDAPTLETENLAERLDNLINWRYVVTAWSKMAKRDFLIEHEIFFPPCRPSEDDIWTCELLFNAKRFLLVPNIVYIWRQADNSITRRKKSSQEIINFWLTPLIIGLKTLADNLCKLKFFRQNPQNLCPILNHLVHGKLYLLFEASLDLSTPEIYSAIKSEFDKHLGDYDILISWLLADLITQQKVIVARNQRIAELERKLKENF